MVNGSHLDLIVELPASKRAKGDRLLTALSAAILSGAGSRCVPAQFCYRVLSLAGLQTPDC